MAYDSHSLALFLLVIFNILLAMAGHGFAGRAIPTKPEQGDKKRPECLQPDPDGSMVIPGIGRIMVPAMPDGYTYGPGGDDTFTPTPEFDIPAPAAAPPEEI